jgi:hypothetical protein
MGLSAVVIAIHLVVPASVPEAAVAAAREVATTILQSAGVQPVWGGADVAAPLTLRLQVLDGRLALPGDAAGYTIRDYAVVSYAASESAAGWCGQAVAVVLGATMAHEIGHLLLPPPSHSASGVMSPRLTCRDLRLASRGELRFTGDEVRAIRRLAR